MDNNAGGDAAPKRGAKPSLLDSANIFSYLTVYWTSPLISLAYRKRLEADDVNDVPEDMHSGDLGGEMEAKWTGTFIGTCRIIFARDFFWIIPSFLLLSATSTATPFLVQLFLRNLSMKPGQETGLNGWVIVALIGVVGIVQSFAINTGFLQSSILAVKVRSALANMVFRKAVKLSSASRASLSSGDVLNLMSQDTERVFFAVLLGHSLWWAVMMMLIVLIVLVIEIGIAGLAAVLFAALLMPVTARIAQRVGIEKRKMLKYTDERVSLSSEMLQGIQTVKMQNWEDYIKQKVFALREQEMIHGKKVLYLLALNAWQVFIVPPFVAAICFGVLAAISPERLTVATIYAVLAFLNTLLLPLDLIPRAAGTFAQAMVSIQRIERFMALKDVLGRDDPDVAAGEGAKAKSAASFLMPTSVFKSSPRPGKTNSPNSPGKMSLDASTIASNVVPTVAEDVILSIKNCTLYWTRKKDDPDHPKPGTKKPKMLKRARSTFASQKSFAFATSFRTGPAFKPAKKEDPVRDVLPADGLVELEEVNVLTDLNLEVRRGELLVVVGEVGSGKTSLLAGILGEIGVRPGGDIAWNTRVNNGVGGPPPIAYVPQESWIQNDSLRNNILFVKDREVDANLYASVLAAVQLGPDLSTLPKGDKTEIGSRGINLSGGQRARVGLARAVYYALMERKLSASTDNVVVACDDPFSALDPNVAAAVWREVIQGLLAGFTRVVCLNSNLSLASKADRVVILGEEKILAIGKPEDVLNDTRFSWLFDARSVDSKQQQDAEFSDNPGVAELETPTPTGPNLNELKAKPVFESTLILTSKQSEATLTTTAESMDPPPSTMGPTKLAALVPAPQDPQGGKLYKAEEKAHGSVSLLTHWKWLKSGAFMDSPTFSGFVVVGFYAFTQALKVFADLWLGTWTRSSSFGNKGFGLGVYFGAVALMVIFSLVRAIVFTTVSARASVKLHQDLITNVLRAPVNLFFDITPVGRVLNRLSSDLDHVDTRLPEVALQLLHALFQILGAIVMAAYASPFILLILLPLAMIFSQLAKRLSRCQRELKRFDGLSRSPLFSHFGETLSGLTTVRSFRVSEAFKRENMRLMDDNTRFFFMFWMTARWLALRVDLLAVCCQFSICALALGTKTAETDTAVVGLAVTYSLLLTTTVQACTRYVIETENAMVACERIIDLVENVPQERADGDETFVIERGDVEFENVSVRYRPHLDLCVKNVSFKVKGGQKVGLCGRSGSAKSTLGNILFGMLSVEPGGRLLFDGRDSTAVSLHCLRSQMSVIPQTPVIFSGTIRFAVDPWGQCKSDAEIWNVLKSVDMDGFVRGYPGMLDGRLDENASSLSVGERQLLCVARALLKKSKIVLLDESTASVDAHSDVIVQSAVEEGFKSATIFIIAHRLHTIVQSDLIVVMDKGELKEFGSPNELLQRPQGMFRRMWDIENSVGHEGNGNGKAV